MGLSRLENFLKSVRGNILYVDPNSLDATDSIENQGNSLTRPFKTIQRALIESARFSYQRGLNNDRFGKTTILVYPGEHVIDNRPGWIPDGPNNFRLRSSETSDNFPPFELSTNFDLNDYDNALYKLNSVHGGVIVPRGTSVVGLDLRKTKIRPKYVPNPQNPNIERSAIFRLTGGCYFWQFSIFDADPNGQCYIDYTSNVFVPNFSHHKLACFEYVDGVNPVRIEDEFQTYISGRTDLEMYYEKIGLAYGASSGREIEPDYPSSTIDIEPKIDEYRIVGSTGISVGISTIISGNGVTPSTTVTVTIEEPILGLEVDTPIRIEGISDSNYNGTFVITEKLSDTQIRYKVQNSPSVALITPLSGTLSLSSDTVTSASPYIFNLSLRSVYGMCGVLADGDKATGFKSMVIAQFTGIGLQKDDNAFVVYDEQTGTYQDNTVPGNESISTNSRAIYKPEYKNFHIKCINDAFIQNVSIFAIGFSEHFSVDTGGDQSITNSNSNFGAKSLVASGFRRNSFTQDDKGYITHIIPPKELPNEEITIEFNSIDVATTVGVSTNERLYLYNQKNKDILPEYIIEGYRVGSRVNDTLNVLISNSGISSVYSSRIVMPNSQTSSEKSFSVGRNSVGINSIGISGNSVITLTQSHTFENGESVRILSDNGNLPDGLSPNTIYYAITNANVNSGLTTTRYLKIAKSLNDAQDASFISINNNGGLLTVVSRVSDKTPGEIGHPIQYDNTLKQWYVKVSTASTDNKINSIIKSLGVGILGEATPRTYLKRKKYNRNSADSLYKLRYVLSKNSDGYARPPSDGFILQESNNTIGETDSEIETYFNSGSITENQQRNFKFISNASWSNNVAKISTELPHKLNIGSEVEIINVKSSLNTLGVGNSGFNGTYNVVGISSAKEFSVELNSNPGTFVNDTSLRTTSLPYIKKKKYNNVYYIYRTEEEQKYIPGKQDGIYYLTVLNSSNSPITEPFTEENYSQPIKELYPQIDRDNPISDPEESECFASSSLIGEVVVNDVRNSITKETISKLINDNEIGIGITNIISSSSSNHTIHTDIDHGLNRVTKVNILYGGVGYGNGSSGTFYNARLVGFAGSITGNHATARVSVNPSGNITDVRIMDGGSAYGIGNTLTVVGIATTTGFVRAILQVSQIYNNVNDVVRVSKVSSLSTTNYNSYNDLYRITGVNVGSSKSINVTSANSISNFSTIGLGSTLTSKSFLYLTGKSIRVNSINYDRISGLATVGFNTSHGLYVGNKIRISGASQSFYNGDFIVKENNGLTSSILDFGVSSTTPSVSGTIYAYPEGITSNDSAYTQGSENISGRMVACYAGITTTLRTDISNETTQTVNIRNINTLDIKIGDYLQIDDEIVRVSTTIPNNISSTGSITVLRGVLGTKTSTHTINSVVRRINVLPIEFRRHSIIRASGHTFEYVGFGPGNYSTAFPDKQNRQISPQEELLAQSTRREGGMNFYTGMNDKGISYSGNKKLSAIGGQEEVFDTPVQTITGEDIGSKSSLNIINSSEANFSRSIYVEGGSDGNSISQFDGPIILRNKVVSTTDKGIECVSLFLQGDVDVSRKYTIGETKPSISGNPGDIQYNASPTSGGILGWVYTTNNEWEEFGGISGINTSGEGSGNQYGVGIRTSGGYVGFSTLINFIGNNIRINPQYNSNVGITTLTFVGLSTSDIIGNNTVGGSSGDWWNSVAIVSAGGTLEIGRYIDFHRTSNDTSDYTYRLDNSSNGVLETSGSLIVNSNLSLTGELNFISNGNKYLEFYTNAGNDVYFRLLKSDSDYHNGIVMERDGGVTLYYNNVNKLQTTSTGITISGNIDAQNIDLSGDLNVRHGKFIGIVTATDFNSTSDLRLKTNISEIDNPLEKVLKLHGVNFEWRATEDKSMGVIAQELEQVLPELVSEGMYKSVNYNGLVGVLIEAIKEQQKQIDDLKKIIKEKL